MTERKTWVIPADKWHARLYRAWRSVATLKADDKYMENLCHYWRVVVFWAPVTLFCKWFFFGKTPKRQNPHDDIPPVMYVVAFGGTLIVIIMCYSQMTWWGATLNILGWPLLFLSLIVGIIKLSDWHDEKERQKFRARYYGEEDPEPEKQPNLLFEVLRAKKHKVCPLIQVEGVEERKSMEHVW